MCRWRRGPYRVRLLRSWSRRRWTTPQERFPYGLGSSQWVLLWNMCRLKKEFGIILGLSAFNFVEYTFKFIRINKFVINSFPKKQYYILRKQVRKNRRALDIHCEKRGIMTLIIFTSRSKTYCSTELYNIYLAPLQGMLLLKYNLFPDFLQHKST